jgi:hypothetical protein
MNSDEPAIGVNMLKTKHPEELDLAYYRSTNPELRLLGDDELYHHYENIGRSEGRPSAAAAFREVLIQIAGQLESVLEIGPFYRPSLAGPNVRYFDVLDYDGLCERAREHDLPITDIPQIHYVSPDGDLATIHATFQAVFSAHVVEHQPCLLSHLRQVSQLLPPGGFYFLAIPDKRYCFDYFLSETTIADVLCAFEEQRSRHTLASVIEYGALTTHNDIQRHWEGDHEDLGFRDTLASRTQAAIELYKNAQGAYIDVHAWQFVPDTFRSIAGLLHSLGLLDLYPVVVYDTPYGRQEFTAVLTKIAASN